MDGQIVLEQCIVVGDTEVSVESQASDCSYGHQVEEKLVVEGPGSSDRLEVPASMIVRLHDHLHFLGKNVSPRLQETDELHLGPGLLVCEHHLKLCSVLFSLARHIDPTKLHRSSTNKFALLLHNMIVNNVSFKER